MDTPFAPGATTTAASPAPFTAPVFNKTFSPVQDTQTSYPSGIACDTANHFLYVTDMALNQVFKMDMNGNRLGQWGNLGPNALDQPQGIAVHNGNVYVADSGNARIVEFDPNGNLIATLQPTEGEYYLFIYPTGVFFDNQGNLYVADNSDSIYRFDQTLTLTGQFNGNGSMNFPANASEDTNGNIYVANYDSDQVLKLASSGNLIATWGQTGSAAGQFSGPADVKVDGSGKVYVVDSLNDRVETFDANGNFLAQFGTAQGLSEPNGMTMDSNGNIFVADTGNGRIVEYSPAN
jgi:DNA-binding beta-propeller fold protein YncE